MLHYLFGSGNRPQDKYTRPVEIAVGVFAAALLALHLFGAAEAWLGTRRIARVARLDPPRGNYPPRVSVVIAARDEVSTIAAGLESLISQDHPDLEILVVDDRSEDGTGQVIDDLCNRDARIMKIRIDQLPEGWLGKNHALARGAEGATGSYLLFTDADVVFAPGTVGTLLAYARQKGLDHLTAAPGIRAHSWPLALLLGTFAVLFGRFTKPWRANDPHSANYIGIGAMNLVRRDAYEAAGGHGAIPLRVDDDLRLGQLLKRRGFSQELVIGGEALTVEWYPSLGAMVRGLEKNAFAGLDFRVGLVVALTMLLLLLFVAPFVLLAQGLIAGDAPPVTQVLLALSCATIILGQAYAARDTRVAVWPSILAPLGVLIFTWTLWRSTLMTLHRKGVTWRGTHYSLAALREAAR